MPPMPRSQGPKKKPNVKVPGSSDSGNRRLLIIGGAAVLAVLVIGGIAFAALGSDGGGGASGTDAVAQMKAAGCSVQTVKALPSGDHSVTTPSGTSTKWNTDPPTSGPHYAQWAIWGAYTTPLYQAQVVHNLEHGGIYLQYGKDVPQATVDQLKSFYDDHLNATLLAPLPRLGDKIAVGVWTTPASSPNSGTAYLAKCTKFDEGAYASFFKAFQFKGPERFPASTLKPGT